MGKTVKKIAKGALFVAAVFGPGAIFSLAGAAIIGGIVAIGELTKRKRPSDGDVGSRLTLRADPSAPRMIGYGRAAIAGTLVYRETLGANNKDLWLVIALAGHEIESIEAFTWGGVTTTFSSNNAVGVLNNLMFRYDKLGTDAQTVETNLDTASTLWTSAHRLRGIAYSVFKLVYDTENNNQIKNPVFTIKGRKLYDPRLDDTNGGSGDHRLADQSTWEWSDNPALCIADYLIGIRVANSLTTSYDGQIIAGMGVDSSRIDWPNITAEANSCDESVNLDAGGSESRYTCNGFIDPRNSHAQNLEALSSSMGGTVVFQSGTWRIYAAVSRAAVKSRDENDMLSGIEYRSKKSRAEMGNAVRGVYADIDTEYKPRDIIPLINSTYVTQDGGAELWLDVNLPMTTSGTMAQRLAKIALERSRMQKQVVATYYHIALQDQVLDSITFSYTPLGLSSEKMRVTSWQMQIANDAEGNTGLVFPMVLEEENDDIYAWDETTDEQAIPAASTVDRVERIADQRAIPAVNAGGALVTVTTNPLTAADVGATTTITVAAHTYQYGWGTVAANSGSITGLAFSTSYFVYFDDPNNEGGAVTYVASTTKTDLTADNGRVYVGVITTPADGGGGTGGGGGGAGSGGGEVP